MKTMYSERIGGAQFGQSTDEYKFEKIKRAKREALQTNPDIEIIDLGVGEPDRPADESVVEVLTREAGRSENRYYADNGIAEFQYAAAAFLDTVYRVRIDSPEKQIIHGIGSKPILAMLPLAFIDTHDVILQPTPGYPILSTHAGYLGGEVVSVPLTRERGYLPDYSRLTDETLNRTKLVYVNYPNNPTGAIAGNEFFRNLLDLARKHNFLIVHDAAYAALTFDKNKPLSILSLPGAFDHAIEIHSLSKSFNMTGWRIAFVVGRPDLIHAYGTVKDNTDSGQFRAIQKAAAFALLHPELIDGNRDRYSRRFERLIPALQRIGFDVEKPGGSFFCYMKIPRYGFKVSTNGRLEDSRSGDARIEFRSAEQFSDFLIRNAGISTVPWDDAGSFVRMSVTFEAEDIDAERGIIEEVETRLARCELIFDRRKK